ncbi:MAG TPA: rod shape-determining protein MreC [Usitatibacteraceae bacterium]|nr:rod shape-determining protein MreC [Usitatibacteraceae bacterium]
MAYQENFFTRGPSPLARLTFFSLLAIGVMVADHRFQALPWMRSGIAAVLAPIEMALQFPGRAGRAAGEYFTEQARLIEENRELKAQVLELGASRQQVELVKGEVRQLAGLAGFDNRFASKGLIAEIIRDARNPYSRKVVIDKGSRAGVAPGRAVIDGLGVVGQVTAVGPFSAEVTLTAEKNHTVPVMVVRNGLRALAVGSGREGMIDVPFIPSGADIVPGDELVTSGIDGTYPAGLAVARVSAVDKNPALPFARIVAVPSASAVSHRRVKVLSHEEIAAYPQPDIPAEENRSAKPSKPVRRSGGERR